MIALACHDHMGAGLARNGTLGADDRDEHTGPMHLERREDEGPGLHDCIVLTARIMDSGVAGTSSGGTWPGLMPASASKIADHTEIGSISGGSPTAFER